MLISARLVTQEVFLLMATKCVWETDALEVHINSTTLSADNVTLNAIHATILLSAQAVSQILKQTQTCTTIKVGAYGPAQLSALVI
jgi:hypothetical protein